MIFIDPNSGRNADSGQVFGVEEDADHAALAAAFRVVRLEDVRGPEVGQSAVVIGRVIAEDEGRIRFARRDRHSVALGGHSGAGAHHNSASILEEVADLDQGRAVDVVPPEGSEHPGPHSAAEKESGALADEVHIGRIGSAGRVVVLDDGNPSRIRSVASKDRLVHVALHRRIIRRHGEDPNLRARPTLNERIDDVMTGQNKTKEKITASWTSRPQMTELSSVNNPPTRIIDCGAAVRIRKTKQTTTTGSCKDKRAILE